MFQLISPFDGRFGFGYQIGTHNIDPIYPEEWALLSQRAVEKRRKEFWIGRVASHRAMSHLGIIPCPILKGTNNEPIWPQGFVGAISHTQDIAIAGVARLQDCDGLGLDIEYIDNAVEWNIHERIANEREQAWMVEEPSERILRLFLLFSAKESIFKAFFPRYHIFLDFNDADLFHVPEKSEFLGRLCKEVGPYPERYSFTVGYHVLPNYVFTYMALPSKNYQKYQFGS